MKRLVVLLLIVLSVQTCSNEIEFNTPAIQGNKDGVSWRADYFAADIDFGGFIFEGGTGLEVLQLITPTDGLGVFALSSDSQAKAIFKGADGTIYSTTNIPDPSVTIYPIEGQISVQNIDNDADPKLIFGEFSFTAFSENGLRSVNFIDGVFFRVPLVGGLTALDGNNQCTQASQILNVAQADFSTTSVGEPDYSSKCNAYKDALTDAIDACGDVSGNLQTTLDGLADCM